MGIKLVQKYNSKNKAKIKEVKCDSCGSTNVTGILIASSQVDGDEELYFNLKTGNIEYFDGEIVEYKEDHYQKYYLTMLEENLKNREELIVLCRNHEDYADVIELTFSDGTKINSLDDFNLEDEYGFEDAIIYLLENDALEFSK